MRVLTTLFIIGAAATAAVSQDFELPSEPLAGRLVFEEKGCIQCHALGGFGGEVGPDLAREQYFGSAAELVSILWNHSPEMNRKYRQLGLDRPRLSEEDMLQLTGFLYYLRYLGEPGSALRGQRLLEAKGCTNCHDLSGVDETVGPSFRSLERDFSPVNLVQAMWNHGPAMKKEVDELGFDYPVLEGDDIGDISAYLQLAVAHESRIRMAPGNPNKGRAVLSAKQCTSCHALVGSEDQIGPDFRTIDMRRSVTQIAGMMWNHGPLMRKHMLTDHVDWPIFSGTEMADLIAFLYFLGFEDEPGDAEAGSIVFQKKNCATCHDKEGERDGPDLASIRWSGSLLGLSSLMWNHASEMEDLVLTRNMSWPLLGKKETQDLFAYLKSEVEVNCDRE